MLDKDRPLPKNKVALGNVTVAYTDVGKGAPILFVHGIPTSSYLWRNVIRELRSDCRCIAPDLMGLGDTQTPLDHRYDMGAQADKIIELADYLGLDTFTLVCHDQGSAAAQWLAVNNQERVERLVLTNGVCYDNWPVPIVAFFMRLFRVKAIAEFTRKVDGGRLWGKSPFGMRLGVYNKSEMSDDAVMEYIRPMRTSRDKFEQFRLFTLAGDSRYSVESAKKFGEFKKPTMVVWGGEDRWLSVSWAKQLYDDIAGAERLEIIPFAGHFWQEEKPAVGATYIREFIDR